MRVKKYLRINHPAMIQRNVQQIKYGTLSSEFKISYSVIQEIFIRSSKLLMDDAHDCQRNEKNCITDLLNFIFTSIPVAILGSKSIASAMFCC